MNRVDVAVDLIARALGLTTAPDIARLTGYLDFYVEIVSPPAELALTECYLPAAHVDDQVIQKPEGG